MVFLGVPQVSDLRPLLFNKYIWGKFFTKPANIDFPEYADDNTPYTYSSNIENMLDNLQGALKKNVSLVFNKSLGSKCRKTSPVNKPENTRRYKYF